MKTVLFTFDYELFLGERSGTVGSCLIEPTKKILSILAENGYCGIFFIDTVYLLQLKEKASQFKRAAEDEQAIIGQLKQMSGNGHFLFPHIHPHWLDAQYDQQTNEWCLSNKRYYRFDLISAEMQENLFTRSMELISSFISPGRQQQIDSYRAGGWCIQPFEQFKALFQKNGIKNEWSVIAGKYQLSDAHQFDFRKAPITKPVYKFSSDVCLEDERGEFTEWTISTLSFSRFEKWIDFKISGIRQRFFGKPVAKGSAIGSSIKEEGDSFARAGEQRMLASFEGLNAFRVKKYIKAIKESDYYHFISHPKLLSEYDFKMLRKLFNALKKMGPIQTDFRKS